MRFLLDENLSPKLVDLLGHDGHDVVPVRVSIIDGSSTTTTAPSGNPVIRPVFGSIRRAAWSSRASEVESIPVACSRRRAVIASAAVLPDPAGPTTAASWRGARLASRRGSPSRSQ